MGVTDGAIEFRQWATDGATEFRYECFWLACCPLIAPDWHVLRQVLEAQDGALMEQRGLPKVRQDQIPFRAALRHDGRRRERDGQLTKHARLDLSRFVVCQPTCPFPHTNGR